MYNIIPIPTRTNEHFFQILDIETPYIAMSKDRTQYVLVTTEMRENCKETISMIVCQPVLTNEDSAPCGVKLFNDLEAIYTDGTKFRTRITNIYRNQYHKLKYTNDWIYTVSEEKLIITCSNLN